MPRVSIALFTRDLRIHDNPMFAAAVHSAERVLPLFVLDDGIARTAFAEGPRQRFLGECLADLDDGLRGIGGRLVIRRGDVVAEVCALAEWLGAGDVHISRDVSGYAARRTDGLRTELARVRCELVAHDGTHTVVPPGRLTPQNNDHFAVFTPYFRRWIELPLRPSEGRPTRIELPEVEPGERYEVRAGQQGQAFTGGESAGCERARAWLAEGVEHYDTRNDALSVDGTSRLSPYLHFGCVSPVELVRRAGQSDGARAFVRQLAWRDFHHQVLAARPDAASSDYRPRGDRWREDPDALDAWRAGRTGIPIVDAGMRQLAHEGWMHNRARMITGSFLTKTLYIDWREGARHFFRNLLDGDIANNCMNWQWVAGTGTDTRPNRVLNPLRQAERFDPDGEYVRRWVPELAELDDPKDVHQPWRRSARRGDYPEPIVDLAGARERFQEARQLSLDM